MHAAAGRCHSAPNGAAALQNEGMQSPCQADSLRGLAGTQSQPLPDRRAAACFHAVVK